MFFLLPVRERMKKKESGQCFPASCRLARFRTHKRTHTGAKPESITLDLMRQVHHSSSASRTGPGGLRSLWFCPRKGKLPCINLLVGASSFLSSLAFNYKDEAALSKRQFKGLTVSFVAVAEQLWDGFNIRRRGR